MYIYFYNYLYAYIFRKIVFYPPQQKRKSTNTDSSTTPSHKRETRAPIKITRCKSLPPLTGIYRCPSPSCPSPYPTSSSFSVNNNSATAAAYNNYSQSYRSFPVAPSSYDDDALLLNEVTLAMSVPPILIEATESFWVQI